jgi:hypothetical protein
MPVEDRTQLLEKMMETMHTDREIGDMRVQDLLDVNPEIRHYLLARIPDI